MGTVIGHGLPLSADPERQRPSSGMKRENTMKERERERETPKQKDRQTATSRHANRKLREGVRGWWGWGGGEKEGKEVKQRAG